MKRKVAKAYRDFFTYVEPYLLRRDSWDEQYVTSLTESDIQEIREYWWYQEGKVKKAMDKVVMPTYINPFEGD